MKSVFFNKYGKEILTISAPVEVAIEKMTNLRYKWSYVEYDSEIRMPVYYSPESKKRYYGTDNLPDDVYFTGFKTIQTTTKRIKGN
jgi:hypothetical protein